MTGIKHWAGHGRTCPVPDQARRAMLRLRQAVRTPSPSSSHPLTPSLNLSLNRSLGPFARRNLPAVLCSLTFHLGIKRLIKFHYKWVGQHIYTHSHTHTHTITRTPTHTQLYVCIFKWGSKKVISLPYDHMAIICDFGLRYSYAHILTVMPGRDELISCQYR